MSELQHLMDQTPGSATPNQLLPPIAAQRSYGDTTLNDNARALFGDDHSMRVNINLGQGSQAEVQRRWDIFVNSLKHPHTNARCNEIKDSYSDTFEWMLREREANSLADEELHSPKWSDFVQWLRNSSRPYLIEGKPGSGKSTLMKFLHEHTQTHALLREWSNGKGVYALFHSFWLMGSPLQYSLRGFLASMAYQILIQLEACDLVLAKHFPQKSTLDDWSERDLKEVCRHILSNYEGGLCLFIDGIDEFDPKDDIDRLLTYLQDLPSMHSLLKICVSSRPIDYILDQFSSCPSLKLQDLTKRDIQKYVSKTLKAKARSSRHFSRNRQDIVSVSHAICRQADGVFLWVNYVLHNIIQGLRIGDNLENLLQRIQSLPSDILELYERMWSSQNQHNAVHMEEAQRIFAFLEDFPVPLFALRIATSDSLVQQYLHTKTLLSEAHLHELLEAFRADIQSRTANLLEVTKEPSFPGGNSGWSAVLSCVCHDRSCWHYKAQRLAAFSVRPIHRTVHDFLTTTEQGNAIRGQIDLDNATMAKRKLASMIASAFHDLLCVDGSALLFAASVLNEWTATDFQVTEHTEFVLRKAVCKMLGYQSTRWVGHSFSHKVCSIDHHEYEFYNIIACDWPGLIAHQIPATGSLADTVTQHTNSCSEYFRGYLLCCLLAGLIRTSDALDSISLDTLCWLCEGSIDMFTPQTMLHWTEGFSVFTITPARMLVSNLLCFMLRAQFYKWHILDTAIVKRLVPLIMGLDRILSEDIEIVQSFGNWYGPGFAGLQRGDLGQEFTVLSVNSTEAINLLQKFLIAVRSTNNVCNCGDSNRTVQAKIQLYADLRRVAKSIEFCTGRRETRSFCSLRLTDAKRLELCDAVFDPDHRSRIDKLKALKRQFGHASKMKSTPKIFLNWFPVVSRKYHALDPIDPEQKVDASNWMEFCSARKYFKYLKQRESEHEEFSSDDDGEWIDCGWADIAGTDFRMPRIRQRFEDDNVDSRASDEESLSSEADEC